MSKRFKPVLALVLSVFMSVSTLSNTYTVFAEEETTVQTDKQTNEENSTETSDSSNEDNSQNLAEDVNESDDQLDKNTDEINKEENDVVQNEESNDEIEEASEKEGDSNMMDYFLVDNPVLSSNSTENFVLSLKDTNGYSDFSITVQKTDGTTFDLEASEQVDKLVKFTKDFSSADKGEYSVTTLHYTYNGGKYYLNFSDLGMDVKFGVDQEYSGYDETLPDMTQDIVEDDELNSAVVQVTNLDDASEEVAEGIMASNPEAAMALVDENSDIATQANEGVTICLDPGHGGNDSGAIGVNNVYEKNLTLKIAQYCKQELEKYNCHVVMTRTGDTNPSLEDRANFAKSQGAQYLISIHLNSAAGGGAVGAEVYYPNTHWRPDISANGKNVAQAIQSQLVSLGLYDRGIKFRTIDTNIYPDPFRYDDGSVADYYGIIRNAKYNGLTGLIIEHCFINNVSDYNNYLSTDTKLQQLGVADANGIVSALGLTKKNTVINENPLSYKDVIQDGIYTIQSSLNSKYVMNVEGGSTDDGGNLQLYQNQGTTSQQFRITHDSEGYVTITNVKSGLVLDLCGACVSNGSNIWQYASNNTKAQKWIVKKVDNEYVIMSALNTKYVIDLTGGAASNNSNIQLYTYNGTKAQKWIFTKNVPSSNLLDDLANQNKSAIADGVYEIRSVKNNSYALDINEAATYSGANLQLYVANGTPAQLFRVSHDSNGYVTFTNLNSQKAIDVNSGAAVNTQNVWQYDSNGTKAQKWIVQKSGSGYKIISALNANYVLDLCDGKVRSGQNIQLYESNGTVAQQWNFIEHVDERNKCDSLASENRNLLEDGVYYIKNQNVKYALDVSNGSLYSGANIWLYELNRTKAQQWIISHDDKGYVTLKNVGSGMYLTATGDGNYSNVLQYQQTNDYNQKWIIMFDKNHNLCIKSALSSKMVLDINGGDISNYTNIQIYEANNTPSQKWVFEFIKTNTNDNLMQIMGTSQTTVAQMVRYYNANTSDYDTFKSKYNGKYDGCLAKGGASTINQFAQIFYEEATAEGVRAEVAFTQCMKETGFLKYGGDVLPNQYNFAGIGATGAVHGASFSNVRMGIRAQIQHLKAYASLDGLTQQCVDPRFNLVKRGSAQYVEWLGTKENPNGYGWATAKNYGYDIVGMVKVLLKK